MGAGCARRAADAPLKQGGAPPPTSEGSAPARSLRDAGGGAAARHGGELRQRRGAAERGSSPSVGSVMTDGFAPRPPEAKHVAAGTNAFAACARQAKAVEDQRLEMVRNADEVLRDVLGPEAKLTKMTSVDGRLIVVVDNAIPVELLESFYGCLQGDAFRRTEFARPDTREFRHHITEYNPDALRHTRLSTIATNVTRACFGRGSSQLEMYRVYTNAVLYGDVAFVHRDSNDHEHVTLLLYPNPEWASELGGETLFYDEHGEIVEAVEPKPGRLCAFHGSIPHKGSPPSRLFFGSRYTTAFKYGPEEQADGEVGDGHRG